MPQLKRFAEALVFDSLALKPGERLIVFAEPAHRELVVALGDVAHGAGIAFDVDYDEPLVSLSRLQHAPEALLGRVPDWRVRRMRAAIAPDVIELWIGSPEFPLLLQDADPARVAADLSGQERQTAAIRRAAMAFRQQWAIAVWPTAGWAALVYPELPAGDGLARLREDVFDFCRVGPEDPDGAWLAHLETLERRGRRMRELDLRSIAFRGPGTELEIGIPAGIGWGSARMTTAYGRKVAVNVPTEEVFTCPIAGVAEGTFRCTRPLLWLGRLVDQISGELRGGRLVRLEASNDDDRDFLARLLDADEGGRRLGEVALVDRSSRIGQAGRTYWNTGFDENVAAHIAFGAAYPVIAGGNRSIARQLNRSQVHIDVMIGGDEVAVTGTDGAGRKVPLIRDGRYTAAVDG